eukprot:m.1109836 g.1109836  ORF g.1109836 m.1109836 type:complete len:51 (-) comp24355_c0_seq5:31-183(-)
MLAQAALSTSAVCIGTNISAESASTSLFAGHPKSKGYPTLTVQPYLNGNP